MEIRLRDNGTHKQDWNVLTVADTQDIELVDPDDIVAPASTTATIERIYLNNDPNQPVTDYQWSAVAVFQLRYQNEDLPWVGRIQERVGAQNTDRDHNSNTNPPAPAASDWTGVFTTDNAGRFEDSKARAWQAPAPAANSFHVSGSQQEHRNVENGNVAVGPAFSIYRWMDSSEAGGMEIAR